MKAHERIRPVAGGGLTVLCSETCPNAKSKNVASNSKNNI